MRSAYRALAGLVALGVVVQAAAIAYGTFSISHAIDSGAKIDQNSTVGDAGFAVHGIGGQLVIPLLAIALLAVSFGARRPGAVKWAGFVLLATAVQVALGLLSHGVPALGWLHGINALVLFSLAVRAARLTTEPLPAERESVASGR